MSRKKTRWWWRWTWTRTYSTQQQALVLLSVSIDSIMHMTFNIDGGVMINDWRHHPVFSLKNLNPGVLCKLLNQGARCKMQTGLMDWCTHRLIPQIKITLILANMEHTVNIKWASHAAVYSWESMNCGKTDFNRCPNEVPLLSKVLWVHRMDIA